MKIFSKYSPFIKSLLISLLAFAILFFGYYKILQSKANSQDTAEVDFNATDVYIPTQNDCLNILLIGCPTKNMPAEFFVLLRFDAIANRCFVSAIPKDVPSTVNVKTMSLEEHYKYGGNKIAVNAVESMFLIDIDRYIRVDKYNIQALTQYFSTLNYTLPTDIVTKEYEFKAGENSLDGARTASLMFSDDESLCAGIVSEYISTNFNSQTHKKLSSYSAFLFENCDTSINKLDFSNYAKPIHAFFYNTNTKVEQITIATEMDEEKQTPSIVQTSMNLMKSVYDSKD